MAKTSIILTTFLFSLCLAEKMISDEGGCRVLIDAHDRAAMYSRNFIGGQSNRWPNGQVPYTISSGFTSSQRQVILNSMRHISDRTCIKFVQRTNQANYVDIFTGQRGCYANLGYNSRRRRSVVHLQSNGCVFTGIVVHELLHILGFGHEQTRADRDQYIQINWGNIRSGTYSNFWRALGENEAVRVPYCGNVGISQYNNCHAGFRASTFGKAYDYGSVMHYGLNYFTNNGQNTMTLKRSTSVTIPNRRGMSQLDAEKTNVAYQCQNVATTSSPGGVTTSRPLTTTPACRDGWRWCDRYTNLCGRHSFINRNCKKTCFNCECKNKLADASCTMLKSYCRYSFIRSYCAKECDQC